MSQVVEGVEIHKGGHAEVWGLESHRVYMSYSLNSLKGATKGIV